MKPKNLIIALLPFFVPLLINAAGAAKGDIYIVEVADAISPGVAEFINSSIAKAEKEEAACVIIELDTPGGLAESMRIIIQSILGSRPVLGRLLRV
jgi:membrane-bound serine protease (ClpP class)